MNEEQKSFPVRYMVLRDTHSADWIIVDTSFDAPKYLVVTGIQTENRAHSICKLFNETEGYRYGG